MNICRFLSVRFDSVASMDNFFHLFQQNYVKNSLINDTSVLKRTLLL